jgi:hypothetical protein
MNRCYTHKKKKGENQHTKVSQNFRVNKGFVISRASDCFLGADFAADAGSFGAMFSWPDSALSDNLSFTLLAIS